MSSLAARLLPPSTDAQYRGAPFAAHLLTVFGALTVVPGLIHSFLPDGGAGVIAGLDLGTCGRVIVALFRWAGATQLALGILMVAAGTRYRTLVPLVLAVVALERGLHLAHAWAGDAPRHPPEHYAVLVGWPVIVVALWGGRCGSGRGELELDATGCDKA